MHTRFKISLAVMVLLSAGHSAAQVTFYEHNNFEGRSFSTGKQVNDFQRHGFNDRASSVVVTGKQWEACQNARFGGQCVVLRPGSYASLEAMGMNNRISSARVVKLSASVAPDRYAPTRHPLYDNHLRPGERLYEAEVTSAHAVMGLPEQRCWVERTDVRSNNNSDNSGAGGAVIGALLGGILGHQIGGGTGNDIATAGGAVAGALVGAKVGRDRDGEPKGPSQDMRRCEVSQNNNRPQYWEVSYVFRNQPHRMQMTSPPGNTVTVNAQGEPRI